MEECCTEMNEDLTHKDENGNVGVADMLLNNSETVKTTKKRRRITTYINMDMIPTKLTYFFWGGLIGTYIIYLNPFFVSIGIPKSKTGVITGLALGVSSITGPLWGILTDYTGRRKLILALICIGAAVWISSLPLVASALTKQFYNPSSVDDVDVYNTTNNVTTSVCNTTHNVTTFGVDGTSDCLKTYKNDADTLFYIFLFIMAVGGTFYNNVQNYIDATAMKAIKVSRNGATYGAQRIFGAIGATVSIYLSGILVDRYKFDGMSPFAMAFFIYVPFAIISIPAGCYLIRQYEQNIKSNVVGSDLSLHSAIECQEVEVPIEKDDMSITKHLCEMFCKLDVVVVMVTALIAGSAFNLFLYFTMFLINEQMEISTTKASFIFSGLNVANIVMFPFTGIIIKLLRGPKPAIIIGIFSHCIRNVVMSYTRTYWVMLSIQVLHCFNFALLFTAMMEYVHEISPRKIVMTMILILQSIHFGFSPFLINMIGGIICQKFDGKRLFRGNGVLCGIWGVVLIIYYGTEMYRGKKEEKTPGGNGSLKKILVELEEPGIRTDDNGDISREGLLKETT